jgi:large subunit ribosomal protein L6
MSRVGKMPVSLPSGVDVAFKDDQINVKGSLGTLALAQNPLVTIKNDAGKLTFAPANDSREANAMSGTMRQLVNNMVTGVTKGFEKKLSLIGVGYKAQVTGAKLNLTVGYSHPVIMDMPAGITAATPTPTEILIKGSDRQRVGQIAAEVRAVRPPSLTRARASVMRMRRSRSKKPRRNKELHHVDQKRAAPSFVHARPASALPRKVLPV